MIGLERLNREGEIKKNNNDSLMKIIKYNDANHIDVLFVDYNWVAKNRRYRSFKLGNIKCPFEPRVWKHGYLGEGEYKATDGKGTNTHLYSSWERMLCRCYNPEYHKRRPTYKDVSCDESWLNFQNFAKWFSENQYRVDEELHLDKDILVKGNKIYSSEACCLVPERINSMFANLDKMINRKMPKRGNKYAVYISSKYIGLYSTENEAKEVYLNESLKHNLSLLDEYRDVIPSELFEKIKTRLIEEYKGGVLWIKN